MQHCLRSFKFLIISRSSGIEGETRVPGTYRSLTSEVEKGKNLDKVKLAWSLKAFQL